MWDWMKQTQTRKQEFYFLGDFVIFSISFNKVFFFSKQIY